MTMCFRVCIDGRSMSKKLGTIHGFKTRRGKQSEILMNTVKISLTIYVYISSKGMTMNATPAKHCLDQEFQNSPLSWAETSSCAKLHDDVRPGTEPCYEFVRSHWMIRQSCRESIFKCRSHITADIHVLEVDARYKIRYDEVFDTPGRRRCVGRKHT